MAYIGSPLHVGTIPYISTPGSKKVGVTVFVHAENGEIIDMLQKECVKAGNVTPEFHAVSRPPLVETEAAQRAIYIAGSVRRTAFYRTCFLQGGVRRHCRGKI